MSVIRDFSGHLWGFGALVVGALASGSLLGCSQQQSFEPPELGLAFVPVETRTSAQAGWPDRGAHGTALGTTFFVKSFRYADAKESSPVETRVIRRLAQGWDFQAYRFRDGDAYLLSLERPIRAPVHFSDDRKLDHEIPSRFDCRSCHEHNETLIIGFDELRLNAPAGGASQTQLEQLAARGVFARGLPQDPRRIADPDERTRELLGYLHGNCAHCHNSSAHSESKLDLSYPHARDNLIGEPTEGSGRAAGVRVVPGAPASSLLLLAFSGEGDVPDLKPMPPLGVQLRDAEAIELLRAWIEALPP